jgi:hypothetical protein
MYDHRAFHDPKQEYGNGKPWKYYGYGYGIDYGYLPDWSHQYETGMSSSLVQLIQLIN